MNETIARFLEEQSCASICCSNEEGNPYCFSCYYVFDRKEGALYFKSSAETLHIILMQKHPVIGGTVLPDKLNKLVTRGIQLQGRFLPGSSESATSFYHKKLPMALAVKGEVFTIQLDSIKMTDSTLGFGKKITWSRAENEM